MTFKFISDPTAAFSAMMAGDIDAFPNYPAPENLAQFEADPRFKVIVGSTEGETILAMNNAPRALRRRPRPRGRRPRHRPPGDHRRRDVRLRHARSAPTSRRTTPPTRTSPRSPPTTRRNRRRSSPRRAIADGFKTTLALPPPSYARRGGEIVASQLRAVGIEAEIVNVEWAQWLEQVFKNKDFGLTIVSHTEPMDIGIYARAGLLLRLRRPGDALAHEGLDSTADRRRAHRDPPRRPGAVAHNFVNGFLFQLAKTGVADARLQGLWANSPTQANDMTGVYWEQ